MKQSQFEKNGGYFIDGAGTWIVKLQVNSVKNVSTDSVSVIGSRATGQLNKMFPETRQTIL